MIEAFVTIFHGLSVEEALRTLPALYLIVRPEMNKAQQRYFDEFFGDLPQNPPQAPLVASIPNPDLFPLQ